MEKCIILEMKISNYKPYQIPVSYEITKREKCNKSWNSWPIRLEKDMLSVLVR